MKINAASGFSRIAGSVGNIVGRDTGLSRALSDTEFSVGYATDPEHGVPGWAAENAIFAGDEALVGQKVISPAAEAMLRIHPEKIQMHPRYNRNTGKYDQVFTMAGDEGFNPLAGQLISPWNITFLNRVWKRPLSYSRAKQLVKSERAGNNPWAEVFTFFLEDYAGWGAIAQTGQLQNTMQNDVNVKTGMASFPIINMMGSYSVTLEEQKRTVWGPQGGSPIARKQAYLNYVFDMMDNILILFGNKETNTPGLLDATPIRMWDTGKSLKDIYNTASTTSQHRGSDAYRQLADLLNDYLTAADNKWSHIQIAMSPEAYNYLQSMPFSDQYEGSAAMSFFAKNYLAGIGPNGGTPSITFIPEPLLKAKSEFNPNDFDLMVMSCPSIDGGPGKEQQATNFYATILDKFVFPVIPGMYNHQYKTLRRVAGMVFPMPDAIRVYGGFGVQ